MKAFVTRFVRRPEPTGDSIALHIVICKLFDATALRVEHVEGARPTRRLSQSSDEWLSPLAQYWL
jgi:hypothetical protein